MTTSNKAAVAYFVTVLAVLAAIALPAPPSHVSHPISAQIYNPLPGAIGAAGAAGAAGHDGGSVQTVKVTLSSAQIKALKATPIQIIAAPGLGKTIQVITGTSVYNYGTVDYTGGDTNGLYLGPAANGNFVNQGGYWGQLFGSGHSTSYTLLMGGANDAATNISNQGLFATVPTTDWTTGDGTVTITVSYIVVNSDGSVQYPVPPGSAFTGLTDAPGSYSGANKVVTVAGTNDSLVFNPLTINSSGAITNYNGTATAGIGFEPIVASVRAVSQVAAITTTNLIASVAANAMYRVDATLNCDTTSAAATVNITVSWTDPGSQAQSATLGSAVACTALGASSMGSLTWNFAAKSGTAITYATAIVNTPTYDIRLTLKQATSN